VRKRGEWFCVGCGSCAEELHHVVYQQELRRAGADCGDFRGMVPVCRECHARHHSGLRPLQLGALPSVCFSFAKEALGAGPAYEYLRRRYDGTDWRLDWLLEEA
jgi:hypothetical protein